jgi:CspA family cold shock protein
LATGTVKRIPNVKNYAFVVPEGTPGEEIFFHRSNVAGDRFDEIRQGQRVTFEIVQDTRNAGKRIAINVAPVEG